MGRDGVISMAATHAERVRALIVAKPGRLTSGLRALLVDAEIEIVGELADGPALAGSLAQTRPNLVVIDVQIRHGLYSELIALIRRQQPHLCCLVLVDNLQQQARAVQAGADATLIKGFTESELLAVISKLFPPSEVHP